MARRTVFKFSYPISEALRGWIFDNWHEFNGWAVMNRINLHDLPSRDLMSLLYYYLTKDMTSEQREAFNLKLEEIESESLFAEGKQLQRQDEFLEPTEPVSGQVIEETPTFVPYKPFEAPPGWTPPGWKSDEEAFNNAIGFMSWQATAPKGGK